MVLSRGGSSAVQVGGGAVRGGVVWVVVMGGGGQVPRSDPRERAGTGDYGCAKIMTEAMDKL